MVWREHDKTISPVLWMAARFDMSQIAKEVTRVERDVPLRNHVSLRCPFTEPFEDPLTEIVSIPLPCPLVFPLVCPFACPLVCPLECWTTCPFPWLVLCPLVTVCAATVLRTPSSSKRSPPALNTGCVTTSMSSRSCVCRPLQQPSKLAFRSCTSVPKSITFGSSLHSAENAC